MDAFARQKVIDALSEVGENGKGVVRRTGSDRFDARVARRKISRRVGCVVSSRGDDYDSLFSGFFDKFLLDVTHRSIPSVAEVDNVGVGVYGLTKSFDGPNGIELLVIGNFERKDFRVRIHGEDNAGDGSAVPEDILVLGDGVRTLYAPYEVGMGGYSGIDDGDAHGSG